jgi:alpha-ketoglutarate-dependent taurine dioxygenase
MSEPLKQRIASLSPEQRALLEKRLMSKKAPAARDAGIPRRRTNEPCPLSFCQQRLWFLDQLSPGSSTYNIPNNLVRLGGPLNVDALRQALTVIVARHEVLRTNFAVVKGSPVQVIAEPRPVELPLKDLRRLAGPQRQAELQRLLEVEARLPFDLARDVMLRPTLYRLADEEYVFQLMTHHIAWDPWSKGIVYRELAVLYEGYLLGRPARLPEPSIQYADFALWQRQWLSGEVYEQQVGYWKRQLAGAAHRLDLPIDQPRPPVQSFRGAKYLFALPTALADAAKALSRQEGVTVFMTFLAAFKMFLYCYTAQEDISVGSPIAGRNRVETEGVVGFFINTLVLRTDLSGDPTYRALLQRVREVTLGAYAHPDLPFEKLVEALRPPRDPSRNPLFQVNFRVQTAPSPPLRLAGLGVEPLQLIDTATSKFDLALELSALEGFGGYFEYNTDLFDEATIHRMRDELEKLLGTVLGQPDTRLKSLDLLANRERSQRLMEQTATPKPRGLRDIRRKAVNVTASEMLKAELPAAGQTLPLLLQPAVENVDLVEWAGHNRDAIEAHLQKYGAILFRGFNLAGPADFEKVMTAICGQLYEEYGDLPREGVAGKIYQSTWYPADKAILFHNESSHMARWPMKIAFFCVKAAERGGETPLLDCREVCRRLDPDLLEEFAKKGVMYIRNFSPGLDVSWQKFFHTDDRATVEEACHKSGMTCAWRANDSLRVGQVCPAVVNHPKTGERVFFNQVQLHHVSCLDAATRTSLLSLFKEDELPRSVSFGDGTPISDTVMKRLNELYWKTSVAAPWHEGDLILLDNMMTAHARNPFVGERKIVVAMGEMMDARALAELGGPSPQAAEAHGIASRGLSAG